MAKPETTGCFGSRSALEKAVVALREQGYKPATIADLVDVSPVTVWKILRLNGVIHEQISTWSIHTDLSGVVRDTRGVLTEGEALDRLVHLLESERDELTAKLTTARRKRREYRRKTHGSSTT